MTQTKEPPVFPGRFKTEAERQSQREQVRIRTVRDEAQAKAVVKPIVDALRTLKGKAIE